MNNMSVGRQFKANFAVKPFCGKSAYANNEEQMQASDAMLRKYVHTHAPLVTSLARYYGSFFATNQVEVDTSSLPVINTRETPQNPFFCYAISQVLMIRERKFYN